MKLSDVFLRLKAIVLRPLVEKELQEEMAKVRELANKQVVMQLFQVSREMTLLVKAMTDAISKGNNW